MTFPSVKLRGLLPALLGLLLVAGSLAYAAPAAAQDGSSNGVSRLRLRFFNPYSPLSSSRITASPFGLPRFLAAGSTSGATSATSTAASDPIALPAVGRPTFRPSPRSPFRPPPRPPFN